jgi:hypothetical protein
MAWPSTLSRTYTQTASANVSDARAEIDASIVAVNDIIDSRGTASGIASLNSSGKVTSTELPTTYTTSGGTDLTLQPASSKVAVQDIINLNPQTVAQLTAIATPVAGDVAYCSNGDAGSACIAVYSGSNWKVVGLGSNISAT